MVVTAMVMTVVGVSVNNGRLQGIFRRIPTVPVLNPTGQKSNTGNDQHGQELPPEIADGDARAESCFRRGDLRPDKGHEDEQQGKRYGASTAQYGPKPSPIYGMKEK
jgi:hypothetical protein